ncbi:MAG: hypothetical protein FWG12_06720 [Holophagaceae bacterium]|nr:hypothetical protein [Holophagaceae bacterium]
MGTVSFEIDLDAPRPPLTQAQKARLDALAAMPDCEIDFSDAPALTEEQIKNVRFRSFREVATEVMARRKTAVG